MDALGSVTVELYGIPRQRAGRPELIVRAGTVAEMLAALQQACPALTSLVDGDGSLSPHYLLSINGQRFVKDGCERLGQGDRILLLSADAGG